MWRRCLFPSFPIRQTSFFPRLIHTENQASPLHMLQANPQLNNSISETAFPRKDIPNKYIRNTPSQPTKSEREQLMAHYLRLILKSNVYDIMEETPLQYATKLSQKYKNHIFLKREDLSPVYSFKLRGAYNKISHLTPEEKARGVITCSAGNHAQGVGFSSQKLGISSKIFIPQSAPQMKIDAVKTLQSEIVLVDGNFSQAEKLMKECAIKENRTLIHPFDDELVIAGQGTIGVEIIKQIRKHPVDRTNGKIDAIFIPCGGGGMLAGVSVYVKSLAEESSDLSMINDIKIIGCNTLDSPAMIESLKKNRRVRMDYVGGFSDGSAVSLVGKHTFRLCQHFVDEMITVSTDELCDSIKTIFADTRVICEPAGALGVASMLHWIEENNVQGKTLVAVVSGSNMDFDKLRFVSERADKGETLLSINLPNITISFEQIINLVKPRIITEFVARKHPNIDIVNAVKVINNTEADKTFLSNLPSSLLPSSSLPPFPLSAPLPTSPLSAPLPSSPPVSSPPASQSSTLPSASSAKPPVNDTVLFLALRCTGEEDVNALIESIKKSGYPSVNNYSKNGLARQFIRYLLGGKRDAPKPESGLVEEIYSFEMPSFSTDMYSLIHNISNHYQISLWAYRNFGEDVCRILVGFELKKNQIEGFNHWINAINNENKYVIHRETDNPVYREYLMLHKTSADDNANVESRIHFVRNENS